MDEDTKELLSEFLNEAELPFTVSNKSNANDIPPPGGNPRKPRQYVVKEGDTWESIAKSVGVKPIEVMNKNPHIIPEYLAPGDFIILPNRMTFGDFSKLVLHPDNKLERPALEAKKEENEGASSSFTAGGAPSLSGAPSNNSVHYSPSVGSAAPVVEIPDTLTRAITSMEGRSLDEVSSQIHQLALGWR
eukprot:jgi/Mesvir1/18610/Mv17119-RA.1